MQPGFLSSFPIASFSRVGLGRRTDLVAAIGVVVVTATVGVLVIRPTDDSP